MHEKQVGVNILSDIDLAESVNIFSFMICSAVDVFLPVGQRVIETPFDVAEICYSYDGAGMIDFSNYSDTSAFHNMISSGPYSVGGIWYTAVSRLYV